MLLCKVVYGEPVDFIVARISARKHGIKSGAMTITCANDSNLFSSSMQVTSYIQGKPGTQIHQATDLKFSIPACETGDIIKLVIPCKTPNANTVYRLKIVLFYTCTDGKRRLYNSLEKVRLSRAVSVDHGLLYPSIEYALLRLNVTGESESPIRIIGWDLETGGRVKRMRIGREQDLIVSDGG
jgi:hypothetical protein